MDSQHLPSLARLIRYLILVSTTQAGSGHPTSCLSAVEVMTSLYFGGFLHFDFDRPAAAGNDRVIFSKGHAAPLLYGLYAAAGRIEIDEVNTLRQFNSRLEGHPTPNFPDVEVATGSLGQGLSIGLGMALNGKYVAKLPYRTYVLLGDSELAEGQIWEAVQLAAHYRLDNLIGIVDVNRLGQRGPTMEGHHLELYQRRFEAQGWETAVVDGHDWDKIAVAFHQVGKVKDKPLMILAQTYKGKGISFLEDQAGWHGRALTQRQLEQALSELGEVDFQVRGQVALPRAARSAKSSSAKSNRLRSPARLHQPEAALVAPTHGRLATRKAFGNALLKLGASDDRVVVLDAELSNSTCTQAFKQVYPDRFFEMFIAEQNMVSAAVGLASRGLIPFVSTYAAFMTRAFDQIRMAQYSQANLKLVGSHGGVSIGADGPSQMGLEDIAMMRSVHQATVLYPADAVSTEQLVIQMAKHRGMVYLRTTRPDTEIIYQSTDDFYIGGSQVLRQSLADVITVVAAGITLHQALVAHQQLLSEGIKVRVIDAYSLQPLDVTTLTIAAHQTKAIVTVEDHYPAGGLGEAVLATLAEHPVPVFSLAVTRQPRSGQPAELLAWEKIDATAIVDQVKRIVNRLG